MIEYFIIFLAALWAAKTISEIVFIWFKIEDEGILKRREKKQAEKDLKS